MADPVDHPAHYTEHPSGVECITITEHMGFCLGNAVKYIWRADLKGNAVEDLRKAAWYIEREIAKREAAEAAACDCDEHLYCSRHQIRPDGCDCGIPAPPGSMCHRAGCARANG